MAAVQGAKITPLKGGGEEYLISCESVPIYGASEQGRVTGSHQNNVLNTIHTKLLQLAGEVFKVLRLLTKENSRIYVFGYIQRYRPAI